MSSPLNSNFSTDKSRWTCVSCKIRKKKCSKAIPTCGLCERMKWRCEYSSPTSRRKVALPLPEQPHPRASTDKGQQLDSQQSSFPAVFFLDAEIFHQCRLDLPRVQISVPQYVRDLVGDTASIRTAAIKYFGNVHLYMPIVAKKVFFEHFLNPLYVPSADVLLLFLCIRLAIWEPTTDSSASRTLLYSSSKRFYSEIEAAGFSSIQVLQAGVLISLYEVGHAIYPAAFRSIGACVTYARTFRIDEQEVARTDGKIDWIESEERRRVWWAILILDRFVNLGNPGRPLATDNPSMSSVLPVDDDVWNAGVAPSGDQFTLSSPTSIEMGRFARFAQAAYLLGQVLQHVSDHSVESRFQSERAAQLHRTLNSLISLSELESRIRSLEFCTQTAICHSAILVLDSYQQTTGSGLLGSTEIYTSREYAAEATAIVCSNFLNGLTSPVEMISPFLPHLLYRAIIIYTELYRATPSESSYESMRAIKRTLAALEKRWGVAGAYLAILEAREAMYH